MSYSAILINSFKNHGIRTENIRQDPSTRLVAATLTLGKLPPVHVLFPTEFLGLTIVSPDGLTDFTISSPDDPAEVSQELLTVITSR